MPPNSRRTFLKTAGALASGVAATTVACGPTGERATDTRPRGFNRTLLDPLAEVVLPSELGESGRRQATDAFIRWVDEYEPVAQEMLGYGYSDIRYLPPDPAPAWRAQLEALDVLARKMRKQPFAQLPPGDRSAVVTAALGATRGDRLPAPLDAGHVAIALLAHWAASPGAWNMALGAEVSPGACRPLAAATSAPRPIGKPA